MILFSSYVEVKGKYTDGTERSFSTIFPKVLPYGHMRRTRAEAAIMGYLSRKLAKLSNDSPQPTSFHVTILVTARLPNGREGKRHIRNDSSKEIALRSPEEALTYAKTESKAAFDELAALNE